ncbi:MAG: T9SS type A sorting domain-containing protein [Muribaculaceae bacterium]|nr:T9SS type A sorting domain-containing protein [Muribaculaceae bacterium]
MKKLCLILISAVAMYGAVSTPAAAVSTEYIEETTSTLFELKVHGQHLEIINNSDDIKPVMIYALTGQIVKQFDAPHGITSIELAAGYYIVKIEKHSQRIVIR